jgi:hypothetical protein
MHTVIWLLRGSKEIAIFLSDSRESLGWQTEGDMIYFTVGQSRSSIDINQYNCVIVKKGTVSKSKLFESEIAAHDRLWKK